jgi:RNA polymerase sigma factor (sigma-70 family)
MESHGDTRADPPGSPVSGLPQLRHRLYRYLLRQLRNTQDAEDLAQEVYLRLLRHTDLKQVRSPQAYLYRIAFNVLWEFRERGSDVTFDSLVAEQAAERVADEAPLPEDTYDDTLRRNRLEKAVAELPPRQRAALRLALRPGLSHAQIASMLGISVSTTRNLIYKAIAHCRNRLADE